MADQQECRYCEQLHDAQYLCAPAKAVLDALCAQGQRFDMPTVEFPEPINHADAFGEDTVLVARSSSRRPRSRSPGCPARS